MNGFAIVVETLENLDYEKISEWVRPLFHEKIGSVPIFECKGLDEYALFVNKFEPGSILLCHPALAETLYGPGIDHNYGIRIETWMGKDIQVLAAPPLEAVDWSRLEPVLDRLEEIL